MYKKKILTMSLAVGLGALTVFGIGKEISIYADSVQRMGDINNDGLINAVDATHILTEYAKISTGKKGTFTDVQKTLADIDKNGFIDAVDATYVLSYYAYISTGGQLDIEKWKESHNNNTTTTTTTDTTTTVTTAYTTTTTTVTTLSGYIATTVVTTENTTSTVTTDSTATSDTTASTVTTDSTATSDTTASTVTTDSTATSDTTASTSATTDTVTTSSTEISQTTTTVTTVTSSVTSSETVTTATTVASGTLPTITGITLTRYDIDIPIGGKDISYVVMYPENAVNKDEIWTTSDEKVATVDGLGYITGISEGSCIVTVTSADNPAVKAEIKVTVRKAQEKVQEIKLSKYNMNIAVGGKDVAKVTMLPETVENKNVVWFTSDYDVATVDPFGNITGVSAGTCIVTVTSVSNPEVTADITVVVGADGKINKINLSKTEMNIPVGGTDISYVTMLPESVANKDEIWTSSNEKVAVVDKWGNVTGVSAGTCIVTVISVDNPNVTADIRVTVTDPNRISEIKLSKTEMNIVISKQDISYVTMLPENVPNKDEIWTTSDEKIAVVDKWGNVTGVSEGTCIVTVTSVNNPSVKADIKVTVTKKSNTNFQQIDGRTYIDGILIANKSYSLPSTYDPGIDATTMKQFGILSSDASKDGLDIYLSSGYRSYSVQQGIYNNYVSWYGKAVADTFSARAGHSEHQTGLAIDVNTIDDSFAGTPEAIWLENNAHKYGFIIRYPKGKESITGYKYEPWHIRYLGVEKATEVYNSGLTLEEYLGIDSYYH